MNQIEITKKQAFKELENELTKIKKEGIAHLKKTSVKIPVEMDSEEFSFARNHLKLTQKELAETLQLSLKSIQGYEQGQNPIPGLVAKTLRLMNSDKEFFCKMKLVNISGEKENSKENNPIRNIIKNLEKDIENLKKIAA
jgi:DNA-binding transcriptional regulator YiaG